MNEGNECVYITGCKFYRYLMEKRPDLLESMGNLYCRNLWQRCKRYILKSSGQIVPDDMWPTGLRQQTQN
jgi:hypothetical protein